MKFGIVGMGVGLGLLAMGCAHERLPVDTIVQAEGSVIGARQAGAEQVPQAALTLKYATDELAQAKKLNADGDIESARRMVERAQADAELSLAQTREAQAAATVPSSNKATN